MLISAQVNTRRGVPMLEEVTFGTFAEMQRGATAAIATRPRQLGATTWRCRTCAPRTRGSSRRSRHCRSGFSRSVRSRSSRVRCRGCSSCKALCRLKTTAAAVIAGGASPEFRTMTIDKGTRDGLAADMAVIAPAGVVGRISCRPRRGSQGAADHRPRCRRPGALSSARARRALSSAPAAIVCGWTTCLVPRTCQVGDRVVTSGIEGIYPKGFVDRADRIN